MLCPYEPNAGPRDDAGAEAPFNLGRNFAGLPFGLLRVKRPALPHQKSAGLKDPALRVKPAAQGQAWEKIPTRC